jgi:hypothetical protein
VTAKEDTFEALATYSFGHLRHYTNCPVVIFRDETFNLTYRQQVLDDLINEFLDRRYPIRQLLAHAFPPFARSSKAPPVCSELVALYEYRLGEVEWWKGVNPDSKTDEWRIRARNNERATIIYDGLWLWED